MVSFVDTIYLFANNGIFRDRKRYHVLNGHCRGCTHLAKAVCGYAPSHTAKSIEYFSSMRRILRDNSDKFCPECWAWIVARMLKN